MSRPETSSGSGSGSGPGNATPTGTGELPLPEGFDVIIVGSGFGGAVTACRLAQAFEAQRRRGDSPRGAERILLLERGRRYERQDFPRVKLPEYLTDDPDLKTSRRVPDLSRLLWGIDQGLIDYRNLGELQVVQGAGLGGGSLVYANVHLRPPALMLKDWPAGFTRPELDPYYDRVAHWLDVSPLPDKEVNAIPKARLMETIARQLGRGTSAELLRPPLAVRWKDQGSEPNRYGKPQAPCNACGNCIIGCQEGAKNTLDLNYLAVAESLGVEVRTLCEVSTIRRHDDRYCLDYFDHLRHRYAAVAAPDVFLAAGSVGTTELLLRSIVEKGTLRPAGADPQVDPRSILPALGKKFFANGDSLGVVFDTKEPAEPSNGPTITTTVVHNQGDGATWLQIQDGGIPPGLEAMLGFFRSAFWLGRNRLTSARGGALAAGGGPASQGEGATDLAQLSGVFAAMMSGSSTPAGLGRLATNLPREWVRLLPDSLAQVASQVCGLSDAARTEAVRLNEHVLRKVGFDTGLASSLIDPRKLVDTVADAVAEIFPLFGNLLRQGRGLEVAIGLARFFLLGPTPSPSTMVLLGMGKDDEGMLKLNEGGRLQVAWTDRANVTLYGLQELMMRDLAVKLGGELRVNPNWTLSRRPITVHAQGGCAMGEVTEPDGEVKGFPGLYVMDAAAFPGSVGVNPASTVAAVAEKKMDALLKHKFAVDAGQVIDILQRDPQATDLPIKKRSLPLLQELPAARPIFSAPIQMVWKEHMEGWSDWLAHDKVQRFLDPVSKEGQVANFHPSIFEDQERKAPASRVRFDLHLDVTVPDLDELVRKVRVPGAASQNFVATASGMFSNGSKFRVTGTLTFKYVQRRKEGRAVPDGQERDGQDGDGQERRSPPQEQRPPVLEGLDYVLTGSEELPPGSKQQPCRIDIIGRKFFHDDPGHDVWPDLTTLYFVDRANDRVGVMRVPLRSFLRRQLRSFDAHPPDDGDPRKNEFRADSAVKLWATLRFGNAFLGGIKDVYERWF